MGFYELHVVGGMQYMAPLTLLLIVNIGLMAVIVASILRKQNIASYWMEASSQVGGFALAFGTFGTLIGLFQAFQSLEVSPEPLGQAMIMGGLKVSVINVLYGLSIFLFSMTFAIVIKFIKGRMSESPR